MTATSCLKIQAFEARSESISLGISDLCVQHGSFCALVAKSGAGKSVLLSVLTGHLLDPWMRSGSTIRFDHFRVGKTQVEPATFASPARLRAALRTESLVYLPQKFPDDRSMRRSCRAEMTDVVCALALQCPRAEAQARLAENCRQFHLAPLLEQPLKDLSGGERKRVEIIARLTGVELRDKASGREREEVLFLLDEPTTGLDVATQREYFLFLKQTRALFDDIKITFIIATHALSLLDDQEDEQPIFDSVLYVRKEHTTAGGKHCQLAYCGDATGFVRSDCFTDLNGGRRAFVAETTATFTGEATVSPAPQEPRTSTGTGLVTAPVPVPVPAPAASPTPTTRREPGGRLAPRFASFTGELHRAYGKQFQGKGKRAVFAIPFLVGLIVFAAFLARGQIDAERFIFFSTIYAFWIGIFNSCQIINGAIASGEWNYWVLALRRSFFNYLSANTLVSLLLSLVQVTVFAAAVLLFTLVWQGDSLFNVFIHETQLPVYFIEHVAGIPPLLVTGVLFFTSLVMAAISGAGLGALVSCIARDTLGALKVAVGVVVVSMVASTTVLKGDGRALPVMPPLFLKLTCPAPFFSAPATFSSQDYNAGFWPHLLEDLSLVLPQRYFFNIGRLLNRQVLEYSRDSRQKNRDFKYHLTGTLEENWARWMYLTHDEKVAETRAELAAKSMSLNEGGFLLAMLAIGGLEALACVTLSVLFFMAGAWITIRSRDNYEIH